MRLTLSLVLLPLSVAAADVSAIVEAANATFPDLPDLVVTADLEAACGGGEDSNPMAQYCASTNRILMVPDLVARAGSEAAAGYMLAHLFGHAAQVRHGVADIALRRIIRDRPREAEYRAMVTAQVECVAGVLHQRAFGEGAGDPAMWFASEPFTGSHWGANPISARAKVSIGLETRARWFRTGRDTNSLASCGVGVFPADLLVAAEH